MIYTIPMCEEIAIHRQLIWLGVKKYHLHYLWNICLIQLIRRIHLIFKHDNPSPTRGRQLTVRVTPGRRGGYDTRTQSGKQTAVSVRVSEQKPRPGTSV